MFIRVYASGTNVQRLAKCSKNIDGVLYTAYSQFEKTEPGMIQRKFYCTQVDSLKQEVEEFEQTVMPSWIKIWGKPFANQSFISKLFQSLVGDETLRPELNLSLLANEPIECFMLLVSANKKEMKDIAKIAKKAIPEWHIKILNGDFTSNKDAEEETLTELKKSKIEGKKGLIVIANQMGSRSYSVSQIQATVIAYDRGSVDATMQKVSRCLTPGELWNEEEKLYGYIVDLSFDPNRAENIERLILEEAIQVQRSDQSDFSSAVRFVLNSIDLFKINEYGYPEEVTEEIMFGIFGDNDAMLKVADISVDIQATLESGIFDILANVNALQKLGINKKPVIGDGALNFLTKNNKEGGKQRELTDKEKKEIEKIINAAIRSLNMSATSVYDLANGGESYRQCLNLIKSNLDFSNEFLELFGVTVDNALTLLDHGVLNEAILDVIVQNSKQVETIFN